MPPRNYRNASRRSRTPTLLLGGFGLLTLLLVGVAGTLWIAGIPLNPLAWGDTNEQEDPYMVRIPINSRPIPAYTKVAREQMLDSNRGGIMYQRVPPEATVGMSIVGMDQNGSHVEDKVDSVKNVDDEVVFVTGSGSEVRQAQTFTLGGAVMGVNAIIGRVVKADKRAGLGFRESTFFPRGTPEGLAGATPEGMRAITLDATLLTGAHSLNAGDEIDLLASVPVPADDGANTAGGTEVEMLAQNAKVLRPVYTRNEVASAASLLNGSQNQNVPKYEVAIAVEAADVIPLQNALNRELMITCIAHSMQPKDGESNTTNSIASDQVFVPVTVRPILAYQVVSRDAFVSPATRSIKTEAIPRRLADRIGAITSLNEALGAITRQDVPAGRYLRHSDLLRGPPVENSNEQSWSQTEPFPVLRGAAGKQLVSMLQQPIPQAPAATAVGDRPALTTFIPPGRTAFAIPLNRIYGAEHLQIGDSIDLLTSFSLERLEDEEETETRPDGTVIVRKSETLTPRTTQRTWEETFGNRAEPWFVATDAIVVAPVGFPAPAAALRAIQTEEPNARRSRGPAQLSGPPVIVAVESRDVESFTTALAARDALFTVAFHAANANFDSAERKEIAVAPESVPAYTTLIETTWHGNRRQVATRTVSTSDPRFQAALSPSELESFYARVLRTDKRRGEFFTADDFYPEGAAQGLSATARVGFTLLPIADREIEGLDSFEQDDRVSILLRAVIQSRLTRRIAPESGVATSVVVTPSVRIVRASTGGQTVLEVSNDDLTRLQAFLARSLTDRDQQNGRTHLIAVGIAHDDETPVEDIPSFDPLEDVQTTELIVGGQRSLQVFVGENPL